MRLLIASPFVAPFYDGLLAERVSILKMLQGRNLAWVEDYVAVRLNGITVPRAWWPFVTVHPEAAGLLEFCVVPQKKGLLPIVASVALVALTAGIGAFGVPFLGAGFAAGTFGASAAAAGVGIAGQLAISALTAPRPAGKSAASAERDQSAAGISQNQVTLLETLPTLHGKMLVSPPVISPPYTTWENQQETIHAICGIQGRCLIANILVNGIAIAQIEDATYETREGGPGDAAIAFPDGTVIQEKLQTVLPNFETKLQTNKNDELLDQDNPDASKPKKMPFKTKGEADEIWIRPLFPSGIVKTSDGLPASVPIRIRLRRVGDVAWRNLPTFHVWDVRTGGGPLKVEIKLKFQKGPAGRYLSRAPDFDIWEITNTTAIGTADEYNADPYFDASINSAANLLSFSGNQLIPAMTGATTSGVTITASSVNGTDLAWEVGTAPGSGSYWRPANNSLPAWLKVDFGSAKTVRSLLIFEDVGTTTPGTTAGTSFRLEGSNDDFTYTPLDDEAWGFDDDELIVPRLFAQVGYPGSYRYYKLHVLANNGAANQEVRMKLRMYDVDASGSFAGEAENGSSLYGNPAYHDTGLTTTRSKWARITRDGAEAFLDPAEWPIGVYEVDIVRGIAFEKAELEPGDSYHYSGAASNFFEYNTSGGGLHTIQIGQKNYRSDAVIDTFSTVSNDVPVDTSGIACISVAIRNTQIDSISAEMTSYAPTWNNGALTYGFFESQNGFTDANIDVTQGAGLVLLTANASDPMFRSPSGLAISGAALTEVDVILRRVSGSTWQGDLFYVTGGHGESASFHKAISEPEWGDGWSTITFDMTALTAGGTDWVDNTITQLRFDFGTGIGDVFQVKAIVVRPANPLDGVWSDAHVPTQNPAALYRHLILGHGHPNPAPGEIVNEDELATWYMRCAAMGHECNFLQQGRSVAEVKQVIATAGYASPRESNLLSVVEDYDRSAEPITQQLSPLNTKLLGVNIPLPDLPHAVTAEYFDAADDWKIARDIIYRDGFDANNATLFDTVTYDGFTDAMRVAIRAAFDMKQLITRARRVTLEIGIEGHSLWRGKLVGHNDDVLNVTQAQGLIRSLTISGGNVVAMAVDSIIPFAVNQDELAAFVEGLDLANATGVAIRGPAGTSVVKTLTNVADGTICTFTTPFPVTDLGVATAAEAVGLKCGFGRAGQEYARMIVMAVEPQGLETRTVTLAAEAPELFV